MMFPGARKCLIFFFSFMVITAMGQMVTPETAMYRATDFMIKMGKKSVSLTNETLKFNSIETNAPIYVFNNAHQQGFVIVSGDEKAEPILGYAPEGTFDEREMPENVRAWLENYVVQMRNLQKQQVVRKPLKLVSSHSIAPLLTTRWGQGVSNNTGGVYNNQCPKINDDYCLAGCVAVSMAQMMNYYQWPKETTAEIPHYIPNNNIGELEALPVRTFDWEEMVDKYMGTETQSQQDAVAWLIRYCGQAVAMNYGTSGSGSYSTEVPPALKAYFGYDSNTRYVERNNYTAEDWEQLVYTELSEGRPVLYKGNSSKYGHSFICDGYDGNGYYHMNWGAEGRYNGYYALSVVNPFAIGEGYTGTENGFSLSQGAVIGIQPSTGENVDERALVLEEYNSSSTNVYATFINLTGVTGTFEYGFQYRLNNDESGQYKFKKSTSSFNNNKRRTFSFDVKTLELNDGVYRFYPYCKWSGTPTYHVYGNYNFYLQVTISRGTVKTIVKHPQAALTIKNLECTSNKVVGMPQEIKVTVANTGEEFNDVLYLFASQTTTKGEYVNKTGMVVKAGETTEAYLYFTPESTGTWYIWADIDDEGKGIAKRAALKIRALPTTVSNLVLQSCEVDARPQATTVTVKIKNNGKSGYYMPLRCDLYSDDDDEIIGQKETANMNIAVSATAETKFRFEDLVFGRNYYVVINDYILHQSFSLESIGDPYYFTVNHSGILGDVNNDGVIDITDLLMLVDYILGKPMPSVDTRAADLNENGSIDISDVLNIVNVILGKCPMKYYCGY